MIKMKCMLTTWEHFLSKNILKWVREVPLRVHDPRKVKMFHILYALPASWCDLLNSDGHSSDGGAPAFDNAVVEVCSSHPCAINGFISRTVLGFFYWSFYWGQYGTGGEFSAVSLDGILLNSVCPSRRLVALNLLLCSDNILGEMMMSWPHLNTAAGLMANEFLPTQDYCTIHNWWWWWWWWGLHQTTSELNITWPLF